MASTLKVQSARVHYAAGSSPTRNLFVLARIFCRYDALTASSTPDRRLLTYTTD